MLEKLELWFVRRWIRNQLDPVDKYRSVTVANMYSVIEKEAKAVYIEDTEPSIHQALAEAFSQTNKQCLTREKANDLVDDNVAKHLTTLRGIMEREFGPHIHSFMTPIIETRYWRNWRTK